jgi:orotate phosphoribosyltransferase
MVATADRVDLGQLRDELHGLLTRHAVRHGTFTLTSGEVSDFYVDCRVVTTMPRAMRAIGALMLRELADRPDLRGVGGLAIGADPIAAAVAFASLDPALNGAGGREARELPMFMVRKEPKGHGMGKQVEGAFPEEPGAQVAIVDDVLTKGGSVLTAIQAVERETKAKVARVVVILDREEGGSARLREMGYEVRSIFTRKDFPKG